MQPLGSARLPAPTAQCPIHIPPLGLCFLGQSNRWRCAAAQRASPTAASRIRVSAFAGRRREGAACQQANNWRNVCERTSRAMATA